MSLSIGSQAPDFTLFSSEKTEVSLHSFKGKNVLILFYPLAFSGTCTQEMCSVRDDLSRFEQLNTEILAISVDSLFTLNRFKEELGLRFHLLSDFNKTASAAYDVLHEEFAFGMKGVSKRSAFIVDKEGVVQYAEITANPGVVPDFDAIKKALEGLK